MIKRFCDKCGKEIGDDKAFIKIIDPNDNKYETECIDLCDDCLWKFHEWMKYPGAKVLNLTEEELFAIPGIGPKKHS